MSGAHRKFRDFVSGALADTPGVDFEVTFANHHKVRLYFGGQSRLIICAGTPSDPRAAKNARACIRRVARELIANDRS